MVSVEFLKTHIAYDPLTGVFVWIAPRSTRLKPGDVAGRVSNRGYRHIMLNNRRYAAHHLAWLWVYGVLPSREIDHINGNRDDNRVINLREATRSENQQNVGKRSDNSSGFTGVSWNAKTKSWKAQIAVNKKKIHIGLFSDPSTAHQAYLSAKRALHIFQPEPRSTT